MAGNTPQERHAESSKKLAQSMYRVRDQIIAFDWKENSAQTDAIILETLFDELLIATDELCELAFEMGFISGIKLQNQV